jgi:hypothetical protein
MKTRDEKPTTVVDKQLYSSIIYEIIIQSNKPLKNQNGFYCKIQAVDSISNQEVTKVGDIPILGGKKTLGYFKFGEKSSLKVKFSEGSSHHNKAEFSFLLHFSLDEKFQYPFLILKSSSFLVYARKPTPPKCSINLTNNTLKINQNKKLQIPSIPLLLKRPNNFSNDLPVLKKVKVEKEELEINSFVDELFNQLSSFSNKDQIRGIQLIKDSFNLD